MKRHASPDSANESAKFLAKAENIKSAYQIWEAFPSALVLAHWQFWFDLEKNLRKKLPKHRGWELEFALSSGEDPTRARAAVSSALRAYIGLAPRRGRSGLYCYPCVQQESDDGEPIQLRLGICLSDEKPRTWRPAIKKLIDAELGESGYKWRPDWWWLAYKDTDYRKYPRAGVVERLATGGLAQEISSVFVDFVTQSLKLVTQINGTI
jgi:hypothetical protein